MYTSCMKPTGLPSLLGQLCLNASRRVCLAINLQEADRTSVSSDYCYFYIIVEVDDVKEHSFNNMQIRLLLIYPPFCYNLC